VIYLISSHSHADPIVREERFQAACEATAELIRSGAIVYSPIVHCHPLADYGLPSNWGFWEQHDRWHLTRCDEVVVLKLDGWEKSVGVQAEVRIARELGKPVRFVSPTLAQIGPEVAS
jgi:hypothetical protein